MKAKKCLSESCMICGISIDRKRSTKKYCSSRCRYLAFVRKVKGDGWDTAAKKHLRSTIEIPITICLTIKVLKESEDKSSSGYILD